MISYKEPLKNVSTWRGFFEPSTVTFFTERERVRIGYHSQPPVDVSAFSYSPFKIL